MKHSLATSCRRAGSCRAISFPVAISLAIALCSGAGFLAAEERLPNVIVVFTDDQGYGDLGLYGAEGYETPHIDRMAAEGVHFTQFYAAQAVCSASRAGLLTGCYPNRIGINGALGPGSRTGISEEETTLAEIFKSRGYATAAFGKWHLGDHERFLPLNHGFDEFFGIPYSNDMWPYHPTATHFPPLPLIEGNEWLRFVDPADQRMLTAWLAMRAVDFIGRHRDEPFFVYVAHPQPHVPLYASDRFEGTTENGLYGDVIAEIDASVGEILNAVKTFGLDEDTLVVFTSDNGPWLSYGTHGGSSGPLREGKGTAWEGGYREPCVMRWPGKIPAGIVCDTPVMTIDLLPTFAHLIGAELPDLPIDGKNVWPLIAGEEGAESPHDAYWIYYKQNELHAVVSGDWKLVLPHEYRTLDGRETNDDGTPVPYTNASAPFALYHLGEDVGESEDLSASHPDKVAEMMQHVTAAREELGDRLEGLASGKGTREPGVLSDEEHAALEKRHWPEGRPARR